MNKDHLSRQIKLLVKGAARLILANWKPFSRLVLLADHKDWVIGNEIKELSETAKRLGITQANKKLFPIVKQQSVFFGNHFDLLLRDDYFQGSNRLGTAYFHGFPGKGVEDFDICFAHLRKHHDKIDRIQVSYSEMKNLVLETGISADKVFQIPIGINLSYFSCQTPASKQTVRKQLGIPETAQVIGSFQKDGVGWDAGTDPKLIKGPDIFLKMIEILKQRIPELFVLLTGPSRGYVLQGLERLNVPYVHRYLKEYSEVGQMYQALDVYTITSREEGGPKAILESMASAVPLVTTRVGQAIDLVKHGENGWMVDIEDYEGLAHWVEYVMDNRFAIESVLKSGKVTAEQNTYHAQQPIWQQFFHEFVSSV